MQVTVRYTGMIQVRLGTERDSLDLPGTETNLEQVLAAVAEKRGTEVSRQIGDQHMVFIEGPDGTRRVKSDQLDTPIEDDASVLFMRPFAGG